MEEKKIDSGMSRSLLARDVYCVCFPEADGMDSLRGELTKVRREFFSGGRRAVRVGSEQSVKGFDGRLRGRLSKGEFIWKKTAGKTTLEEAFDCDAGHVLVKRSFQGVIVSRTYFDREHRWIRSEYYEPWDSYRAKVSFRPSETGDVILRFDAGDGGTRSTELFPAPYSPGTAEQSVIDARFGEPRLVLSTADGDRCYCRKEEADARKAADGRALSEVSVSLGREVKEGRLTEQEAADARRISFTSLDAYAEILPDDEKAADEAPAPAAEETAAMENERPAQEEAPGAEAVPPCADAADDSAAYRGDLKDGLRDGFGAYFYENGHLCYAGGWKDDKRHGPGVSFRETDHAMHITRWENGDPGSVTAIFDKDGALTYAGRIENGKKQGAGVRVEQDGSVFVARWENGEETDIGAVFDSSGALVYYGHRKDGLRQGRGTEFDQNGAIVFDGEWKDDRYFDGILYRRPDEED